QPAPFLPEELPEHGPGDEEKRLESSSGVTLSLVDRDHPRLPENPLLQGLKIPNRPEPVPHRGPPPVQMVRNPVTVPVRGFHAWIIRIRVQEIFRPVPVHVPIPGN